MNLEYDQYQQHKLDLIAQQLEILIMDILLASINQIKYDYENALLKTNHKSDDIDF